MSNLVSTEDAAVALQALDDLWDTMGESVTIVKEPIITTTSMTGVYVPGFGLTANEANFSPTPTSATFPCLVEERKPDKDTDALNTKQDVLQFIFLKVKQDGRDYIQDGRVNLHAILKNRKYNIVSDEEARDMLTRTYYVFKLEIAR